ncbi:MAG: hypothetical protein OXH99_18010, partial [Bryobacterales bacterium]|nr:hypothetical protein [Bryobacterales bacterium]
AAPASAPAAAGSAGLVEALETATPQAATPPAAPAGASRSRSVSIVNHITLEARPSETDEAFIARLLRALERRQALAGREALGDAY